MSANFAHLGQEVEDITSAGADYIHVDIMDGHFVPNITMGPDIVKDIRPHSRLPFDVHLMISDLSTFIPLYANAGADIITIHPEATPHIDRHIQLIKSLGKKTGIALNPGTSLENIEHILYNLDQVLIMTVNPGFGGQKFIPAQLDKIRALRAKSSDIDIEVDGGITPETAQQVIAAGANVLVAGTSVFSGGKEAYARNIAALRP